jgi:hypothetical protein
MSRSKPKQTAKQTQERIDHLEAAVGELQQFVNLIASSARNDIIRHDDNLKALCKQTGVEFIEHPVSEENIEESQGGSE